MIPVSRLVTHMAELSELFVELEEQRANLVGLRAKQQSVRAGEIKRVRKTIARTLTKINGIRRESARAAASSKYVPKDLREKKTRAIRRRLLPEEVNAKTLKQKKKASAFPQRKYAIKA